MVKNSRSFCLFFLLKTQRQQYTNKQTLLQVVLKHREDHLSSGDMPFMELRKECVKKFRLVGITNPGFCGTAAAGSNQLTLPANWGYGHYTIFLKTT